MEQGEHGKKDIMYAPKQKQFTYQNELNGEKTINPIPARFSPVDKYGKYRRAAKKRLTDAQSKTNS